MTKNTKVCIIGLGYVGLPLAILCSKKGYETYGVDIDRNRLSLIDKGINPLDNSKIDYKVNIGNENSLKESSIIIVCVPTPVDESYNPDLKPLLDATEQIARNIQKEQLIVIESTISPGIIDDEVKPILEKTGLKAGIDFYLAHCPERVDPGNKKWDVESIPRVIGASSPEGLKKAYNFYKTIINGEIKKLSSIRSVEAVKMIENAFRDVNIAYVNELAKIFDKMDLDTKEIIQGASTKPFGFMPHYPSCGVGGHCIPVDPYYLIKEAEKAGYDPILLKNARKINNSMPQYTINLIKEELAKLEKGMNGAKIGILGLSYKANISDIRNSPALEIIKLLKKEKAITETFDPYIKEKSTSKSINELLERVDYVILATNHDEFKPIDSELLKRNNIKIIIDGKNMLNKEEVKQKGIAYRGIGSK